MSRGVRSNVAAVVASLFAFALAGAGCRNEPYCLNCTDGLGGGDGYGRDVQAIEIPVPDGPTDARPDLVIPDGCMVGATEICNGVDDNCDGVVDEGIDTQTDPRNCGGCGMACQLPHAVPACMGGRCVILPMGCDVGFYDINHDPADGCEYACTPVPGATDDATCNRRDDDCDGTMDEDVNLCGDAQHCGSCSRACLLAHATVRCARTPGSTGACTETNTRCEVDTCAAGHYDINGDPADGCEYECTPTGAEVCNGLDDDCDGTADNGDPGGGAACGVMRGECRPGVNHCRMGTLVCEGGVLPTAELCNGLDDDCDGTSDNGSLAADTRIGATCGTSVGDCRQGTMACASGAPTCTGAAGPTAEACDGRDNNCDGVIDNGVPPGGACGTTRGRCVAGTLQCSGGVMTCTGAVLPTAETCNTVDDDCDGTVDNGFDLNNDPANCGACGNDCGTRAHAYMGCVARTCTMLACEPGFVDRNGLASDGCEYACTFLSATEVCNGLDDNCNGTVDEGIAPPAGFCRSGGACGATAPTPTCMGTTGWRCSYPATVDLDPTTGQPAAAEVRCDGIDNNCNGAIDEPFSNLNTTCRVGPAGTACENVGRFVCNGTGTGTACNVTTALPAQPETCNGRDDDCDGSVDETAIAPGTDATRFVSENWVLVQPTRTCGVIPGSNGTQAVCAGNTNCDTGTNTNRCLANFWCDATEATPTGATPARNAVCRPYYWVMQYEASAPNASGTARGDVLLTPTPRVVNRACSLPGVLPWTNVTQPDADAACTRIGATLCTEGQWQAACEVRTTTATTNCLFGYNSACTAYAGSTCNGLDFDYDTSMAATGDQDGLLPTGSARVSSCGALWTGYTGAGTIFDLSGNAREITSLRTGLTNAFPLRGGSYVSPQAGLRCDSNWTVVDNTFSFPNVGFRCCYTGTTPP
jgi:hypothetical protein